VTRIAPLAAACLGLLLLGGCQVAAHDSTTVGRPQLDKRRSVEITPADDEFGTARVAAGANDKATRSKRDPADLTAGELYELPKLTVSRKGFRKLGLSVVTNTEVAAGGTIEWMRVGVVLPDSPAARQRLFTGIEILAINDTPVAHLSRDEMLHALFEREEGQAVRLLLYSRHFGPLPRFVTL
jgi:hypothetical protein